jgi:hypothetical protein
VFEGNQLLRIKARKVGLNLDVVIAAIAGLNGTDPGMLVGNVALGDRRQLHTPIDGYDRIILYTGQQLVDLSPYDGGSSPLKRDTVQVRLPLRDRSLDCRQRAFVRCAFLTTSAALSRSCSSRHQSIPLQ